MARIKRDGARGELQGTREKVWQGLRIWMYGEEPGDYALIYTKHYLFLRILASGTKLPDQAFLFLRILALLNNLRIFACIIHTCFRVKLMVNFIRDIQRTSSYDLSNI